MKKAEEAASRHKLRHNGEMRRLRDGSHEQDDVGML